MILRSRRGTSSSGIVDRMPALIAGTLAAAAALALLMTDDYPTLLAKALVGIAWGAVGSTLIALLLS